MRAGALGLLLVLLFGACASSSDDPVLVAGSPPPSESSSASPSDSPSPSPSPSIPVDDGDFSFVAIGDWGAGTDAETDVAERMCRFRNKHPYSHVFTTGDNIYPDGDPADFKDNFYTPHACSLGDGVRWHSSLGNHDVITDGGRPEIDDPTFGIKRRNYVVRKAGVRFVLLDSNDLRMRLVRRATRSAEGDRWTVVLFHHPVFSGGTGHGPTPGFAEKLTELFTKRGVDLVLNGHDHVYSASKPVGGIRYVVTGGGGASLVGCRSAVAIVRCESRHHFLYVTVTDDNMRVYAVPIKGSPFHTFKTPGS